YQVGRPWMFDGKMLRGLTGIPIRRNDLANSSFAEAEPEPLTLANFTTKSLSASMRLVVVVAVVMSSSCRKARACAPWRRTRARRARPGRRGTPRPWRRRLRRPQVLELLIWQPGRRAGFRRRG